MRRRWLWIVVDVGAAVAVLFLVGSAAWRASSDARAAAVRALTEKPGGPAPAPKRPHLDRAYDLFRAQQWKESLVHFDAALELDPANAEATYFRGAARAQSGALDLALADFLRVMELDPDRIDAYRYADWILAQRGDWYGIVAHWDRYIERHPDSGEAWCERAGARKHGGDREAALADARRACDLGWAFCCAYVRRAAPAP